MDEVAGTITKLEAQKRNPDRGNVHLDGEFAFGLAAITAAWLKVGQPLSDEKIAELRAGDEHEAAYEKALRYLGYRPRSEAELRRHLKEKGIEGETAEGVLARLKRAGLADDDSFARFWVENREAFRPRGKRAVAAELRQRGVSREAIEVAVAEVNEEEAAWKAASDRARRLKGRSWPEFRAKLGGFLARRGFNYETISPVVRRAWQEMTGGSPATDDEESEV